MRSIMRIIKDFKFDVVIVISVVSVAKQLRWGVRMWKVLGLIPVIRTAFTHSHQPTQLFILLGLVNEYQGYSFYNIDLGHPSRRFTSA